MEPLIGYCKLCGQHVALSDYTLVEDRKDSKCVIDKNTRRVHELVYGIQEKTAIRQNEDRSQRFATNNHGSSEDEPAETPLVEALEDIAGLNQIAGGEEAR